MVFIFNGSVNAQLTFKPGTGSSKSEIHIGEEKSTPLIFGNNKFKIEFKNGNLNFLIPSPNPNSGDFKLGINPYHNGGYVSVGKKPDSDYKLDVVGDIACGGQYYCRMTDRPYSLDKNDRIINSYNRILLLSGKSYIKKNNYSIIKSENEILRNDPNSRGRKELGFIAQEFEYIFPSLVDTDSEGYKSINYLGLIPVLIDAVKDQKQVVDTQSESLEQIMDVLEKLERIKGCELSICKNTDVVEFKYKLGKIISDAYISIFTINGILVKKIQLKSKSGIELIAKSDFTSGIYFYTFVCEDYKAGSGTLNI